MGLINMTVVLCCIMIILLTVSTQDVVSTFRHQQRVLHPSSVTSYSPSSSSILSSLSVSGRSSETLKLFNHLERVFRQLPVLWNGWTSGNTAISRQVFDMIDIVTDVAMLTVIGIPILGLVAAGATALSPLLGSVSAKESSGRAKRETASSSSSSSRGEGFVDRAGKAILYARNLYDIVSDLEEMFQKYEITSNDCQLRAICEVHRVGPNSDYADFGDKIIDIVKMEKEVEEYEVVPLAKLFFQMYADAAKHGTDRINECGILYPNCDKDIIRIVRSRHKSSSSSSSNLPFHTASTASKF